MQTNIKKPELVGLALLAALSLANTGLAQNLIQPTLIRGTPANLADFPASVRSNGCTATVVGERTLFIASHCVTHGATQTLTVGANQYSARCSQAPLYRQNIDHDIALCVIDKPVVGIKYENLNLDASLIKVGDKLQLTGYGCVNPGAGTGGNDGIYRVGEASIRTLPNSNSYDIVTDGGSALCFGDSGGPAFKYLDAAKKYRVVVSANSKGDISTTSYLASSSSQASIDFIKSWSTTNSVKICGVHADAVNCRAVKDAPAEPNPPTPEVPGNNNSDENSCQVMINEKALDVWESCLIGSSKPALTQCDRANDLIQDCYADR